MIQKADLVFVYRNSLIPDLSRNLSHELKGGRMERTPLLVSADIRFYAW